MKHKLHGRPLYYTNMHHFFLWPLFYFWLGFFSSVVAVNIAEFAGVNFKIFLIHNMLPLTLAWPLRFFLYFQLNLISLHCIMCVWVCVVHAASLGNNFYSNNKLRLAHKLSHTHTIYIYGVKIHLNLFDYLFIYFFFLSRRCYVLRGVADSLLCLISFTYSLCSLHFALYFIFIFLLFKMINI